MPLNMGTELHLHPLFFFENSVYVFMLYNFLSLSVRKEDSDEIRFPEARLLNW